MFVSFIMSELRGNKTYGLLIGFSLFASTVYFVGSSSSREKELYLAGKECVIGLKNEVRKYSHLSDDQFNNNQEISDFVKNKFFVKKGPFKGEKCLDVMEKYIGGK